MWGLFGGAIEDNETYLYGLKREINEELNINIKKKKSHLLRILHLKLRKNVLKDIFTILKLIKINMINLK